MKKLVHFLDRLEAHAIFYKLSYHRQAYIMVEVAVPGERWEVEFSADGEVEIEIFSLSGGVFDDEKRLEDLFIPDNGIGFSLHITLKDDVEPEAFINKLLENYVEPLGLALGGDIFADDGAFVTLYHRGDVTEAQRQAFDALLQADTAIATYRLSELTNGET